MTVFGLTIKAIQLTFRLGITLHERKMLIPFLILFSGLMGAYFIISNNPDNIPLIILAAAIAIVAYVIMFTVVDRQKKKDNPDYKRKRNKKPNSDKPSMQSYTRHGIVFGKVKDKYICKPETTDGHALIVGFAGSGKSSCLAIPTLQKWGSTAFVIDIKGELLKHSELYRTNIKVFNPTVETSYGYDPFYCLRKSSNPAQEARAIAQAIIPLPIDVREPFWIESAQAILCGVFLHCNNRGLSFLRTIQHTLNTPPKHLVQALSQSPVDEVRYCVSSLVGMDEKTLAGIMGEVSRNILPFVTDKDLISALSREKNITPEDLEYGRDVYIQIPEHLVNQWRSLLTLIVNQFLRCMEQRNEENAKTILFLLDEFPRLGKITATLDGLATLRSKKVTICLIVQSLAQLDVIYGEKERKVIADNCTYKAVLGAGDYDTQKYFSGLAGKYEKKVKSNTRNKDFMGLIGGTAETTHQQEKDYIKSQEFSNLEDIILFCPNACEVEKSADKNIPFCRVEKAPYYEEVEHKLKVIKTREMTDRIE
jgi:type IV secretion system protein VirD4